MAHIPSWELISSTPIDFTHPSGPIYSIRWQCVICAVFATDYFVPNSPGPEPHSDSEELPDA